MLQSRVRVIKKWGRCFVLQSETVNFTKKGRYYKMRQLLLEKWGRYQKAGQNILQSGAGITKLDNFTYYDIMKQEIKTIVSNSLKEII